MALPALPLVQGTLDLLVLRTLATGPAVLQLLLNAPGARVKPRAALSAIHPLVRRARVVRGARGEAREAAMHLLAAMDEQIEAGT